MPDSNTLNKADATKVEHPAKETAKEKQVDIRKKPDMKELQALIDIEEGKVLEDEATSMDEQKVDKKIEVEKKAISDRYKGKTAEELIAQLEEKEKYIQSRSDEMGKLKKEIEEAQALKKKVEEIESGAIIQAKYKNKIPPEPVEPTYTQDDFYNDPVGVMNKFKQYQKDLQAWNRQYLNILSRPILDMSAKTGKEKIYDDLEKKYTKWPVKFDRIKIQAYLDKNPEYFDKYKTDAYEKAYHDTAATEFSQNDEEIRKQIREEERKKLLEEMNNQKQAANIGLSDLNTQPINPGSSPAYDEDRMEEDPEYRDKVLADIEKRNKK